MATASPSAKIDNSDTPSFRPLLFLDFLFSALVEHDRVEGSRLLRTLSLIEDEPVAMDIEVVSKVSTFDTSPLADDFGE